MSPSRRRLGLAGLLWIALAGLVAAIWGLAFAACAVTVPGLTRNACPRPVERGRLVQAQAAHAALQARLATLQRDMAERDACPPGASGRPAPPQPRRRQ